MKLPLAFPLALLAAAAAFFAWRPIDPAASAPASEEAFPGANRAHEPPFSTVSHDWIEPDPITRRIRPSTQAGFGDTPACTLPGCRTCMLVNYYWREL